MTRGAERVLFVAAITASAFLIFLVQPIVGKRILPWYGGAPAVWTLCLAFYQSMLFLGYAYAHLLIRFAAPGVQLVVQNITFVDGNAKGIADTNNRGGGGAIYAQGGSLKVVNARFFHNVCDELGSDVGGGAIRKLDYLPMAGAGPARPAWIVNSTFGGGEGLGNSCANGGALSSIGVSWNILNSWFSNETAVGHGANDGEGGNGGAI